MYEQIDVPDTDNHNNSIEHNLIKKDEMQRLFDIWPQLDERSQFVLRGRYFLEQSQQEMAEELGVKPDSIRMLLTRARKNAYHLLTKETIHR